MSEEENTPRVHLWEVIHDISFHAACVCYDKSKELLKASNTLGMQEVAARLAWCGYQLMSVVDDIESPAFLLASSEQEIAAVAKRAKTWREEANKSLNLIGVKLR